MEKQTVNVEIRGTGKKLVQQKEVYFEKSIIGIYTVYTAIRKRGIKQETISKNTIEHGTVKILTIYLFTQLEKERTKDRNGVPFLTGFFRLKCYKVLPLGETPLETLYL